MLWLGELYDGIAGSQHRCISWHGFTERNSFRSPAIMWSNVSSGVTATGVSTARHLQPAQAVMRATPCLRRPCVKAARVVHSWTPPPRHGRPPTDTTRPQPPMLETSTAEEQRRLIHRVPWPWLRTVGSVGTVLHYRCSEQTHRKAGTQSHGATADRPPRPPGRQRIRNRIATATPPSNP
jgi:hypothetical protein